MGLPMTERFNSTFIQRFNQPLFFEKNFKDTIGRTTESFSNELAENNCRPNDSGLREGLQNTPPKDVIPKLFSALSSVSKR